MKVATPMVHVVVAAELLAGCVVAEEEGVVVRMAVVGMTLWWAKEVMAGVAAALLLL